MSLASQLSPARMTAINVALAVLLVGAALLLVRDGINLKRKVSPPVASQDKAVAGFDVMKPFMSYAPAIEQNPFGIPGARLERITGKANAQSTMDVKVLGIIAWPNGRGYAMLSSAQIPQEIFKVGREIPGVGTLKAVTPYTVTIETAGRAVTLKLVDDSAPIVMPPASQRGARGGGEFVQRTSDTGFSVEREALRESIDNPKNLMTDARLVPNMEGGSQKGFILKEVRTGGIYQKLGLQNNDVLLRLNEFPISDAESALQAFTALKGLDRIEVDVVRGGNRMTLTYSVQ